MVIPFVDNQHFEPTRNLGPTFLRLALASSPYAASVMRSFSATWSSMLHIRLTNSLISSRALPAFTICSMSSGANGCRPFSRKIGLNPVALALVLFIVKQILGNRLAQLDLAVGNTEIDDQCVNTLKLTDVAVISTKLGPWRSRFQRSWFSVKRSCTWRP